MNSKNKSKSKKNTNKITIIITIFLFVILSLTIGYSAFSDQLTITNIVSHIRVYKEVRINGVTTSSGAVSDLDYNTNSILNTVYIPAGGSVTYSVTATNLGNVPVAVSAVSFSNGNGTVNNLSSNVSTSNYIKICDNNNANNCTNGVSKTFDITITNNGSSTINTVLDVNLTFSEVYTISYDGNQLGEAVAGSNYTYTFPSNAPETLAKTSGTCDSFNYTNNTITIINVGSDMNFTEAYTVTFDNKVQALVSKGDTYTYTFTSKWPKTITCSGTYGTQTYTNDILTITNITSDIDCTPTYGEIKITNLSFLSAESVNSSETTPATANGMEADFNIKFERAANATTNDFIATYDVTVANEFYNDYIFNGFDFDPEITVSSPSDSAYIEPALVGINQGDTIPARTTKTFKLVLTLIANNPNGSYGASGNAEAETTEPTVETGDLTATITPSSGNLSSPNTSATFTVTVTNTYESEKSYTLTSGSSNFIIVDGNDNPISKTIAGNSTDPYTVYVKTSSSAMFKESSATTTVYLISDGMANYNVGNLTFTVDVSQGVDTTPPTVSITDFGMVYESNHNYPSVGKLKVSWSGADNQGGSGVKSYTAILYDSSGSEKDKQTVGYSTTSVTFPSTGQLDNGTYYAVVYGEDNYYNNGSSYVSQADSSPYADKTSSNSYTWSFTVDKTGLSNLTCSEDTAYLNQNFTCTIKPTGTSVITGNDNVPDSLTSVYLGTRQLGTNSSATSYYKYTKNGDAEATLTIYNVTDTPKISGAATSSCLVEGTKIKLYDGTYKNIEDIKYYDLLSVWSYDTGSLTYEYPIWIEKSYKTDSYQETTFSDGTILKTVGLHQVFSLDDNKFVNIYDENGYIKVGTRVAKEVDGKIVPVKVTKVETINKKVNYYYVASSIYYNIISEDIITTSDQIVPGVTLSNMYGFDENIKWPSIRNEIISKEGALYDYKDLDIMPYYLYYGARGNETKLFVNLGYATTPGLIKYLLETQLDPDRAVPPITDKEGNRLWMITTSDDNIKNYKKYLHKEGYVYTLKEPKSTNNNEFVGWLNTESYDYTLKKPTSVKNKEFVGWFNTVDGKMYKVGEKYKLIHGTHFIAIYK